MSKTLYITNDPTTAERVEIIEELYGKLDELASLGDKEYRLVIDIFDDLIKLFTLMQQMLEEQARLLTEGAENE